jgi:voltage-gated sodium channel
VMEIYPYAWAFFLPFILVTTFAVVNLLVGLVVNSMQDAHHTEDIANTDAYRDDVKARLDAIDKKLDALGGERKG